MPAPPSSRQRDGRPPDGLDTRIVGLLARDRAGDDEALELLITLVYDQLLGIARGLRRGQARQATLNTTAIVHEAFLRLRHHDGGYQDRGHFFAVAARAMRQLLIDQARRVQRVKRGGGLKPLTLLDSDLALEHEVDTLLSVHRALERLAALEPRWAKVVECRYFGGLTEDDTALALGVSARTVRRDWIKARAWLTVALGGTVDPGPR